MWWLIFMMFSFGLPRPLVDRVHLLGASSHRFFHTFSRSRCESPNAWLPLAVVRNETRAAAQSRVIATGYYPGAIVTVGGEILCSLQLVTEPSNTPRRIRSRAHSG